MIDFLMDMTTDWPGRTLLLLMAFAVILILGLIGYCIDRGFGREDVVTGRVASVRFVAAHTETWLQPVTTGKVTVMIPHTRHVPDTWVTSLAGEPGSWGLASPAEVGQSMTLPVTYGLLTKHRYQ